MKDTYDSIVVGSGPSGAAAAKKLTDEGAKVLVLEKKKLPRYKICSGIIFKKSQEITERYFGKIPDSVYVKPKLLKGVRFWSSDENYSDWPFSKNNEGAPNIWRSEYDYWLISNSGAEVVDCSEFKGFEIENNVINVHYFDSSKNKLHQVKCRYLVSAEGSKSKIRAMLSPEFERNLKWFIAYQNYYEGQSQLDPYFYHGFLDQKYGEVYAWFSVKDDLQVFGTSVRKGGKVFPCLSTYRQMLEKVHGLTLKKLIRKTSCLGNNMCTTGNFYLGKGNILLVGEAAGFLNAFGEGISCALSSGLFAAEAICTGSKPGADVISVYTELTKKERRQTTVSWKLGAKIAGRDLMPL
ncbi:MAG: NAD(P)/FAD-dependent oxidoreductase [Candidatus Kuenenia sp.]|nr:NAD(P)/FAD-dependent oxidoreductase [Candidatus Kuenenia hertensis]